MLSDVTLVRCPACGFLTPEPPTRYPCGSCGRTLRWRPRPITAGPLQLGLFGESVPVTTPRQRRPAAVPPDVPAVGVRSQSTVRNQQDALAAATELFFDEEGYTAAAVARAREFFRGHSTADLQEAALGAAFLLASTLRVLERNSPGAGREMLEGMGLALAEIEADQ